MERVRDAAKNRRGSYERCGGHAAVRSVVEDVALARALKKNGARIALCCAARVATARGYGSFRENVRGYGRSLFFGAGAGGSLAYVAWQFGAFVAPWLLLPRAALPAAMAIAASVAARAILAAKAGEPLVATARAPLEGFCGAIAGSAATWIGASDGFAWRGRRLVRQT